MVIYRESNSLQKNYQVRYSSVLVMPNIACTKNSATNRLEEQILNNTNERIILLLIRLCKTNAIFYERTYQLTNPFTIKDFANMIGVSADTISKTIQRLYDENLIFVDHNGFYHLKKDGLQRKLI